MKKIILLQVFLFCLCGLLNAQFAQDYPFKTYVDNSGFLYVTGDTVIDETTKLIKTKKFNDRLQLVWERSYNNPFGNDKGMDIIVEEDIPHNVYVTGYVYDNAKQRNSIVTIKHDAINGNIIWTKTVDDFRESKGFGITLDQAQNIYVGGYITGEKDRKDFLSIKYDRFGNQEWLNTSNFSRFLEDDVATDILVDEGFVYLMGYAYQGPDYMNDLLLVSYEKSGAFSSSRFYKKAGTDDYPTGFTFANLSRSPITKSRTVVIGHSDNVTQSNVSDILTICFNNDLLTNVLWSDVYNNEIYNGNDIATAVTVNKQGTQIYVTGYSENGSTGKDFVTIKYRVSEKNREWVNFFDYPSKTPGNDRASSVLIKDDSLYVTGSCDRAPNGFWMVKYPVSGSNPPVNESWSNTFIPSFLNGREPGTYNSASILGMDSTGNIINFYMGWNNEFKSYAAQKFDPNGNVLYTLDPDLKNSLSIPGINKANLKKTNIKKEQLKD
ncbi:MAG: hypothetical protein IPN57_11610 [Ignavibacteria bacterium]|nr:hypothetical protein [Ignavibacteria bacterium]